MRALIVFELPAVRTDCENRPASAMPSDRLQHLPTHCSGYVFEVFCETRNMDEQHSITLENRCAGVRRSQASIQAAEQVFRVQFFGVACSLEIKSK